MKKYLKLNTGLILSLFLFSCPSDDECTKNIIVQYEQTINGTLIPQQTQEVPCDFPEPEFVDPNVIEGNELENFTYEVLSFNYLSDTGNNTSLVQFEIKLNNNNDFIAEGRPILTIATDDLEFSSSYSVDASIKCNEIAANSSCIFTVNKEYEITPNIVPSNKFELKEVVYLIL